MIRSCLKGSAQLPDFSGIQAIVLFNEPSLLENILGYVPQFTDSLTEITACMAKLCGNIYADENAIACDLHWLQQNTLIAPTTPPPHHPYLLAK